MVRKVRLEKIDRLLKDLRRLRSRFGNLISVGNAEWYSLFKDEIRNSIAICTSSNQMGQFRPVF